MTRKAIIVVLTAASLWTLLSWAGSYAPRSSWALFNYGSVADGMTLTWYVYEGASSIVYHTYKDGRGVHMFRHRLPPIWVFLLLFAAYPAVAFAKGPIRRWRRRRNDHCVACGAALQAGAIVCSGCGHDSGDLLRLSATRYFTLSSLHAAIMITVAFGFVLAGRHGFDWAFLAAIVSVLLAFAAPLFGLLWSKMYVVRFNRHYLRHRYCQSCRYDLTGNVSGVCPECGRKISPQRGSNMTAQGNALVVLHIAAPFLVH